MLMVLRFNNAFELSRPVFLIVQSLPMITSMKFKFRGVNIITKINLGQSSTLNTTTYTGFIYVFVAGLSRLNSKDEMKF